jgi:hypothetical protein
MQHGMHSSTHLLGLSGLPFSLRQGSQAPLENLDQLVPPPLKGLGQSRPAASHGAGKCIVAGTMVETAPVSGPKFRSAGRRPFHNFPNFGPSAREYRPVDELASPVTLSLAIVWWICWQIICRIESGGLNEYVEHSRACIVSCITACYLSLYTS